MLSGVRRGRGQGPCIECPLELLLHPLYVKACHLLLPWPQLPRPGVRA